MSICGIPDCIWGEILYISGGCVNFRASNKYAENLWHNFQLYKRFCKYFYKKTNHFLYKNNWKKLLEDKNGWVPTRGEVKFKTVTTTATDDFCNCMDIRHVDNRIFTVCERDYKTGSSYLRVFDDKNLDQIWRKDVPNVSLNCVDVFDDILAIGDDGGGINLLSLNDYTQIATNHRVLEVNDLRITDQKIILSIRTNARYPSGLEVWDLVSDTKLLLNNENFSGHWIHSLELTSDRHMNETFLVGEDIVTGKFEILKIDFRTKNKIVSIFDFGSKKMLWPLRVDGNKIFANLVNPHGSSCIRECDQRLYQYN
eukprot:GHVL01029373.1.p1 GENE.GHVL01029373.1~~GHVL01029373.1.p1  ORF type:complete len:321 (-),score=64.89 GHVL01029373.1:1491-2426(-)